MRGAVAMAPRWINRVSIAITLTYAGAAWAVEPVARDRSVLHLHVVFALGYGHLLASIVHRRGSKPGIRGRRARPDESVAAPGRAGRALRNARAARTAGTLLALTVAYTLYAELCARVPSLPIVLLGVSAWHTVENHRAIARSRLDAAPPIAPLRTSRRALLEDGLLATGLGVAAVALPTLTPGWIRLDSADVVAAFSLHHLVTWLLLTLARASRSGRVAPTLVRLVQLHAPMMLLCGLAIVLAAPAHPRFDAPSAVRAVAELLLAPATYLFWSAAHVVHTAWRRRPR